MEGPSISCLLLTRWAARKAMAVQAVESFLAQTWPHKELIVVNNGFGLPGHYRLLEEVSIPESVAAQEIILDSRKRSFGRLWNIGLAAASGDAAMSWDDDDWSHPRRLEELMRRWEPGKILLSTTQLRYCLDTNTAFVYENPTEGCSGIAVYPREGTWFDPDPEGVDERHGEDARFLLQYPKEKKRLWANRDQAHYFIRLCHRGPTGNDRSYKRIMRGYARRTNHWELDSQQPGHLTLPQAVYLARVLTDRYGVPESWVPPAVREAMATG